MVEETDSSTTRRPTVVQTPERLLAAIPEPLLTIDRDWRITFLNDAAARAFGDRATSRLGSNFWAIFPAADEGPIGPVCRRVMQTRVPERVEGYHASTDAWFDADAFPTEDGGIGLYYRDVTARKQAEERLRLALEASRTGMWEWDLLTDAVTWTAECYVIHGVTRDEFDHTGAGFFRLVHPDDRHRVWTAVNAAIAHRTRYECEFRVVRPDGALVWVSNRGKCTYGPGDRGLRVLGTITDIDARRRADDALRESRERLQAALSGAGAGTFRWDIVTGELAWDENLDRLFGLPPGRTARSLDEFVAAVHPDDRPGVIERCRRCATDGADFDMTFRVVWPDGAVRWLDDKGKTCFDQAGRPVSMTGMCVDVTDRVRAESDLAAARRRADFLARALADSSQPFAAGRPDGSFMVVNRAFAALTGYSEEELKAGTSWATDLTPPEWRDVEARALAELHRTRQPQHYCKEYVRKDGSRVSLDIRVHLTTADDGSDMYYSFVSDVTERDRAERVVRDSEALYRAIAANLPGGAAFLVGPDLRY